METTIRLSQSVKKKLDLLKVHSRESYNDVISRITEDLKKSENGESLKETVEILSEPDTIRDIAEALEDYEKGRFVEFK